MINSSNFTFEVSYSNSSYSSKPTSDQIKFMHFVMSKTNVDEFVNKISSGYAYCAVYNFDDFGMSQKKDSNFAYTQVISVDVDKTTISLNEALKRLKTTPTMAYNTFSNGHNDLYCYRLVYVFQEPIESIKQAKLYTLCLNEIVSEELNIKTDANACKVSQYFNGTNDSNVFVSDCIYELDDFNIDDIKVQSKIIQEEHHNIDLTCTFEKDTTLIDDFNLDDINLDNINKSINPKSSKENTTISTWSDTFKNDTTLVKDFWRLNLTDFLNKYDSLIPNIQNSKLEIPSEDEPFIDIPSDYREIKRYWYLLTDDKGHKLDYIRKIRDGEGRRKKLFINGIIRRLINPSITFENMLHNIVWEFVTYMINDGNKITKAILFSIVQDIMKTDMTRYSELGKTTRKWMVNPYFALKHNMSKREVINKFKLNKNNNKKQFIGELYDCSLSDKENIEKMKEYGLDISLITLKRWRKENNIRKYKTKHKSK